ncbi:alpha-L-rhamnosidase [Microbacterium awajiense]|uniref:alpha-L-rhamnosidase n=1 Tax=Microbacterium awajiense TaxID=415214 RepID=A0ABP7AT04_9MICO
MTAVVYVNLETEGRRNPREVDKPSPRLTWNLAGGEELRKTRIVVERVDELGRFTRVWATSVSGSEVSTRVPAAALEARAAYRWTVSAEDGSGAASAEFETGYRGEAWTADWIARRVMRGVDTEGEPDDGPASTDLPRSWATMYSTPPTQFRHAFMHHRSVARARLYISAHGVYRAWLNGVRIGDDELAPGWTRYESRVDYRAHDVTHLLRDGENVLGATVADGWWSGYLGYDTRAQAQQYGTDPELIAELHLRYADGTTAVITTDTSWQTATGEIVLADLLMGEFHDYRSSTPGWLEPGYAASGWSRARTAASPVSVLTGQKAEPIRAIAELAPVSVRESHGRVVVDFGQNIAGRVRLRLGAAQRDDVIQLRHGESVDAGDVYVENLRSAEARDIVVATGDPEQVFEPLFTQHGFRYVEITGLRTAPGPNDVRAVVLSSDLRRTGGFSTGSELVNRLHSNIVWSMIDNFVGIPTDCPQRDERLGWTADAQIFAPTASFNVDTRAFFSSWLEDLFASQSEDGCVPDVAPVPPRTRNFSQGAPGWGDAAVIVPWVLYREYGDRDLLAHHYPGMRNWVEWVERNNPGHLWKNALGNNFGDWLSVDEHTPHALVAAAYQIRSLDLLTRAARELGHIDDEAVFGARAAQYREQFAERFIAHGRMKGDSQSGYLFALSWNLAPEPMQQALAARLAEKIEERGARLTSGFHGISLLGPVLSQIGRNDLALSLVLQRDYPSWGYSIDQGATTIWERWDAWTEHGGYQDVRMNSFNHYSMGSIGDWLYRRIGGIDQTDDSVGYERLEIAPLITRRLSPVSAWRDTPRGRVEVEWQLDSDGGSARIVIPPGTQADVVLPGVSMTAGPGIHDVRFTLPPADVGDAGARQPDVGSAHRGAVAESMGAHP